MTSKRLTIALAALAALVPAAGSAYAAELSGNRPANYGTCISQAAMFAEEPVREWTQAYSPSS